eukprot:3575887-Rhodomonas_salina.2
MLTPRVAAAVDRQGGVHEAAAHRACGREDHGACARCDQAVFSAVGTDVHDTDIEPRGLVWMTCRRVCSDENDMFVLDVEARRWKVLRRHVVAPIDDRCARPPLSAFTPPSTVPEAAGS